MPTLTDEAIEKLLIGTWKQEMVSPLYGPYTAIINLTADGDSIVTFKCNDQFKKKLGTLVGRKTHGNWSVERGRLHYHDSHQSDGLADFVPVYKYFQQGVNLLLKSIRGEQFDLKVKTIDKSSIIFEDGTKWTK